MLEIKLTNYQFYKDKDNRTLKYVESYPHKEIVCSNCNCTRFVEEKPEGEPHQRQWIGKFIRMKDDYKLTYSLDLRMNQDYVGSDLTIENGDNRAYFRFNHVAANGGRIENSLDMYLGDDIFITMYFGNQIDAKNLFISGSDRWMAKHQESINSLSENEVWIYRKGFYENKTYAGFTILRYHYDETPEWNLMYGYNKSLREMWFKHDKSDLKKLHEVLSDEFNNIDFISKVIMIMNWGLTVSKNPKQTMAYRIHEELQYPRTYI